MKGFFTRGRDFSLLMVGYRGGNASVKTIHIRE
jgi:hypothetical protein